MLMQDFVAKKPVAVFFSSYWTVGPSNTGSSAWWPLNVQQKFAKEAKVYVIAANTTDPPGQGGGIFAPDGSIIDKSEKTTPAIITGVLPAP
jgi:hypothetical protein